MVIRIGNHDYNVERIMQGAHSVRRAFQFTKPDGTVYDVCETDEIIHCTCPDSLFRNRDCTHVRAVKCLESSFFESQHVLGITANA